MGARACVYVSHLHPSLTNTHTHTHLTHTLTLTLLHYIARNVLPSAESHTLAGAFLFIFIFLFLFCW